MANWIQHPSAILRQRGTERREGGSSRPNGSAGKHSHSYTSRGTAPDVSPSGLSALRAEGDEGIPIRGSPSARSFRSVSETNSPERCK